jgi:carotenoid cleavage dioxygenase-like enzyme
MLNHNSKRYSQGFTSLEVEITANGLPIKGKMPQWLAGSLYRTGPAKFEIGDQKYHHWFDGLAMLHRFSFDNGKVNYANKFLRSSAYTEGMEKGKISYSEFATDPCQSIFKKVATSFMPDKHGRLANANVNILRLGDDFVAMTETPLPVRFEPETLETLGVMAFPDKTAGMITTAHPHYDRATKSWLNYLTHFSAHSEYNIYAFDARGRRLIGSYPVQEPAYMHSFATTENYIILAEFPLVVNPLNMLLGGKPFIENFVWKPGLGTNFVVMSKEDGQVTGTYQADAFFAFHHINAFEKAGDIFIDISAYPDAGIVQQFCLENLLGPQGGALKSQFRRYHLPAGDKTASYEQITDEQIDLPRINFARNGAREYRFAYGASQNKDRPADFLDQIVKIDTVERLAKIWFENGTYPGEPVFVAAPGAGDEDEGVILSVVLDSNQGKSFLLVLDAKPFTEVARVELPHHVPFGFHGIYTE